MRSEVPDVDPKALEIVKRHAQHGNIERTARAITALLREQVAQAFKEGQEAAAKALDVQAREIADCAETYDREELGSPRESLMRESGHYAQAADFVRRLPLTERKPFLEKWKAETRVINETLREKK